LIRSLDSTRFGNCSILRRRVGKGAYGYNASNGEFGDMLESALECFHANLQAFKEFFLPPGGPAAVECNLARTIARRAEHCAWMLAALSFCSDSCDLGVYNGAYRSKPPKKTTRRTGMNTWRESVSKTAILIAWAIGLSACHGGGVTPITETVNASIGSVYWIRGSIDQSQSCASPNPTPAAPDPQAWWTGIDPQTRQTKVAVGWQFWSNSNPGCATTRHDIYRGLAAYDLASLKTLSTSSTPIQSLITGAKLSLTIGGGNPTPTPIGACVANFGGVGAIEQLEPGFTILSGLTQGTVVPPVVGAPQFPAGANSTSLTGVAVPGTSGRVTTSVGGGGMTVVDVDVKDLLIGALTRGDASFGIMLDGTSETLLTSTADVQAECRTLVTVGPLTVQHL
jgi:hypothetical protein